jgi:hypothetical protein
MFNITNNLSTVALQGEDKPSHTALHHETADLAIFDGIYVLYVPSFFKSCVYFGSIHSQPAYLA